MYSNNKNMPCFWKSNNTDWTACYNIIHAIKCVCFGYVVLDCGISHNPFTFNCTSSWFYVVSVQKFTICSTTQPKQ